MHFGFALDLSDIDLLNIDLLHQRYTHLDLFVPKTSSRHVFKTSSRNVFKTSSRHVFKTSSIRLQRNNFSSSNTSSRRLQDVFARRLQDVLEDEKLLRWRCLENVLQTNKCLLGCDTSACCRTARARSHHA